MIDATEFLSNQQPITVSAVSSTINLGSSPASRALSLSGLYLVIFISLTLVEDDPPPTTVTFSLESDSADDLSDTPVVHWRSADIPIASLLSGYVVASLPLPTQANYKRYLGVRYTLDDGAFSAGHVTTKLQPDPMLRTIYPNGI